MFLHALLQRWRHTPAPTLPPRVASWLANEDGKSLHAYNRAHVVWRHDLLCASLPGLWLPRKGGFSDAFELEDCPGCGLTFLIDAPGLHYAPDSWQKYLHEGDEDFYDAYWCDCCWRSRDAGHPVGTNV